MAYAFCHIEKIKSVKGMTDRYNHNLRVFDVANADPALLDQNSEPVDLMGKTYQRAFRDEITRLKIAGAKMSIRKDAVLGFEVMLTYSREATSLNVEEWVARSVEWLQDTFNPPDRKITFKHKDTGKIVTTDADNVKSVVVHMDESTPHIHAFIIPISPVGNLSAKYYTHGRDAMVSLQSGYAAKMSPLGLERGVQKSLVRHQDISSYYQRLKKAVSAELPPPEPGETVEQYHARVNEVYRTALCHFNDREQKLEKQVSDARAEASLAKEEQTKASQRNGSNLLKFAAALGLDELSAERVKEARRTISQKKKFDEGKKDYPDQKLARETEANFEMIANWQRRRERKEQEDRPRNGNSIDE